MDFFINLVQAAETVSKHAPQVASTPPSWLAYLDVVQYVIAALLAYFIWTIKLYKEDLEKSFVGLRAHIKENRDINLKEMSALCDKVDQLTLDFAKMQAAHDVCRVERRAEQRRETRLLYDRESL